MADIASITSFTRRRILDGIFLTALLSCLRDMLSAMSLSIDIAVLTFALIFLLGVMVMLICNLVVLLANLKEEFTSRLLSTRNTKIVSTSRKLKKVRFEDECCKMQ
ncbi:hypothetical protein AC579_5992 [Pseudocercospora musae]|uniref:Uncharacterized protein n=1 Tax=Pseudocercospora musae TaxID=113226 RepID=A0A139I107_9PEZI|nr:hypothetical protein AC579_5992 [Pseudocercospora musae]